MKKVPL